MPSNSLLLLIGWMLLPLLILYPARILLARLGHPLSARYACFYLLHPLLVVLDLVYASVYASSDQPIFLVFNFLVGFIVSIFCVADADKAWVPQACRMVFNLTVLAVVTLICAGAVAKFI